MVRKTFDIGIFLVLVSIPFSLPSHASGSSVETHLSVNTIVIEDSIRLSLPANAKWSFSALDLKTGKKVINTGNATGVPLIPGSLAKLFITAAALDMDSRERMLMDTIIATDGMNSDGRLQGNIYIKGSGNAFLSRRDVETAVEEIRSRGIREITGDIIADDFLFAAKGGGTDYHGPAHSSPGALGLDLHTISIAVRGRPPNVEIEPPNYAVKVSFTRNGQPSIRQIDDFTYEISGDASESMAIRKRFPLKDPAVYAAWTLKTLLRERAINHGGSVRRGTMPSDAIQIYSIKSRDLSEIIKDTNNNSLNVVAENLLLLLGARRFGPPGTLNKGIMAVREFLNDLGFSPDELDLADGSGLSPDNRITSGQMVSFLRRVSEKWWFGAFFESLPRAGMEGTIENIGYKNGHIRAKTGQLRDAYCIAGYVERGNNIIAFSYMVNVPGAELLRKDSVGLLLARIAGERL